MVVRNPYKAFKVRLRLFFLELIGYRSSSCFVFVFVELINDKNGEFFMQ